MVVFMENIQGRVIELVKGFTMVDIITGTNEKLIELGIDSLTKVELIISLEDEFEVLFNDSDLIPANFNNIQDLVNLVSIYVGAN